MRKLLSIFLACLMLFALGCQAQNEAPAQQTAEQTQAPQENAQQAADTPAPAEEPATVEVPEEAPAESGELLISAAASMTDVLDELVNKYMSDNPNVVINCTYGSSGALQTQIEEGAPADIFISAAQKQMTALEEKDLLVAGTKKTLLENSVVLIVPSESSLSIQDFAGLTDDGITKVALGEPEGVPVGQYSEEIFNALGILDEVKSKAVYGSDVRTVLTWVEEGEVDCGVVYKTDAMTTDRVKVVAEAPADSHEPVTYPIAVIKDSQNIELAQKFLDYLITDESVTVFENYGFKVLK